MNTNRKPGILVAFLFFAAVTRAPGDFLITPQGPYPPFDFGATEDPFLTTSDFPDIRYQQVYRGSEFALPGSPLRITELSFASALGAINVTLPSIAIHLSTTSAFPDGLSSTFAQNVGADDAVVFSGSLHFFQNGTGPVGSFGEVYNIRIALQTPFVYDPTTHNLLLDVFNYQTIAPMSTQPLLAEVVAVGDGGSSRVGRVGASTSGGSSAALLTGFTYTTVPEPSTILLLAAAGIAAAGLRFIRVRQKRTQGGNHVVE